MVEIALSRFADEIDEIMQVISREFTRQHLGMFYKDKITLPQFLILNFLCREGASRMTILAKTMKVTTAAMTGIVERLVRDGYAQRDYDPKDRRIVKIKLTPQGNALVKKVIQQKRRMIIKIFSKISESDRQHYLRILRQVKDTLGKEDVR